MGFNGSETQATIWDQLFPVELTAVALDSTGRFSLSFTGTATSGTNTISSISDTTGLQKGMVVTRAGVIPTTPDTYITAGTSNSITLSANATASGSLVFIASFYLYDWKEKAYHPATGALTDVEGARAGSYALEPGLELNNQKVGTGSYVWGRFRSCPEGEQVFEFVSPISSVNNTSNITYGNVTQNFYNNINYYGGATYPTYITYGPNVNITFNTPITINKCLIMAGPTPTAPSNAPTITVGGGGTGSWPSGTYYFKVTYVDYTGAESPASPESAQQTALGSPNMTVALNNTPGATISYWRIYVTQTNGASGTETLVVANDGQTTVYDIPVGTTTYALPAPIWTTTSPPSSSTTPSSCFLPPTCCGKPAWTDNGGAIVIDLCATPPTIWEQTTKPTGTAWKNIIGCTAKGDLISHNGTDSNILSAGTNGYVLQAYSTFTNGVGYAQIHSSDSSVNVTVTQGDIDLKVSGSTPPTSYGTWVLVDLDYTDFPNNPGSFPNTITKLTLQPKQVILHIAEQITQAWNGPFGSCGIDIGYSGGAVVAANNSQYFSLSSTTTSSISTLAGFGNGTPDCENLTATWNLTCSIPTYASNPMNLTGGHIKIWLFVATLP